MRIVRVLAAGCVAFLITATGFAQTPGTKYTLQQCVETALSNNLTIKQAALKMDRANVSVRGAIGNMIPAVDGIASYSFNQGRFIDPTTNEFVSKNQSNFYGLSGSLILFQGFRWFNNLKATQFAHEATKMELQQQKDQLMLNVILAYLDILRQTDLLALAEQRAQTTRKQVERLEILHKEGAVKPAEMFDVKGQLGDDELAIVDRRNLLNQARLSLAQLMNITFDENLEVARLTAEQFDMSYNASTDSIYQVALTNLPIIKAPELRIKSAEKALKSNRSSMLPSLYAAGGYNTRYSNLGADDNGNKLKFGDQLERNKASNVEFGVNIPILNNFTRRNNAMLAKLDLKESEYISENNKIQLRQNIERDHLNLQSTLNQYKVLVDQVASYAESYRAAEVLFNNGATNSVDYLIAKNKFDNSNINLVISRYDYVLRTKILDYYQSKPLW